MHGYIFCAFTHNYHINKMEALGLSFLFALLCGFLQLGDSSTKDCSGACKLQFRCDPYAKNLTWTVTKKICRVFQNSCHFGSHNCQRENQCLMVLTETSQRKCMKFCPACCRSCGTPVCASFSYLDFQGVRTDRQITFPSLCHANKYACQNADAYIGEPTIGPCS